MSKSVFTKEDFNSNDGMLTTVWGPTLWHSLHTMSFNYPVHPTKEQKQQFKTFIFSLRHVLPCGACRKNLVSNLEKVPLTAYALTNRNTFSRWLYRLHEQVNDMTGKDKNTRLTYEEVRDRYENFRARCSLSGDTKAKPKQKTTTKIEDGCVEPLYGVKSKCIIDIVPRDGTDYGPTLTLDPRCKATR